MPKDKESTTRLKIDTTEFKRGISDANRAIKLANSEFKAATSSMDNWADSTEGQQAKLKQLNAVMDAEKQKLSVLQEQYKKVVAAQGENSAEAENLKIRMNNQEAAIGKVDKELKDYKEKLKGADDGTKNLTSSEEKAEKQTENLSGEFSTAKVALGNFIADGLEKGIGKLGELADAAKQAYEEFDQGADNVIKATGATGSAADSLKKSYENVAKSVKGDMSDLGAVVGEVSTRFGFVDEKLEKASVKFKKFADITEIDAKTAVQLVSRAMEKAGIESDRYEEVLDKLAYASQATGVDVSKLAQNLADNGSAFKQLGLDVDAQIGLLASFERGGVNVSAALGGMKKAVGNWAKEGKNANTEFKKTMDMIQKAPSDTEAARIAVETFGAKSGVELAEAMRTGKFSYDDFANSLKKSSKTVENTYEGTQDGLDKINLAMQGVKVDVAKAFGELLDENKENIDDAIRYVKTTVIPKAKSAITWIINNFGTITTVAKGVATTIGTIWVLKKTASFAQGISDGVKALTSLSSAADSAKTSQEGLNAAQSASPINLLITATALLAGGLKTIIDLAADNIDVVEKETDRYQELHDEIKKNAAEWKELTKSRDDNVKKAEAEFDYLDRLKTELDTLVDENGKVKTGYEERAKFITDKLSEATGIEIQNNGKVIDSYKKVSAEIDNVLKKKRANAILEANDEAYKKAVVDNDKNYSQFTKAKQAYEESKGKVDRYTGRLTELDRLIKSATTAKLNDRAWEYRKEYDEIKDLLDKEEKQKSKSWSAYVTAKQTYEKSVSIMTNYERLSAAIMTGDSKQIEQAVTDMNSNFKRAETSTRDTLDRQKKDFENHYKVLKQQLESNTPGVTQAMVDQAKTMCDRAVAELERWDSKYSDAGNLNAGAYAGAFTDEEIKEKMRNNVSMLTDEALNELIKEEKKAKEEGEKFVTAFTGGMTAFGTLVGLPSIDTLAENFANEFNNNKYGYNAGEEYGKAFIEGLRRKLQKASTEVLPAVLELLGVGKFAEQFSNFTSQNYGNLPSTSSMFNSGINSSINNNFYQTINSPKEVSPYEASREAKKFLSLYGNK